MAVCLNTWEARAAVQTAIQTHGFEIVHEEAPNTELPAFIERVSSLRPQIVFLETSRIRGPVHRVVESLRAAGGGPAVVVMHPAADPEIILDAMRAGAA